MGDNTKETSGCAILMALIAWIVLIYVLASEIKRQQYHILDLQRRIGAIEQNAK